MGYFVTDPSLIALANAGLPPDEQVGGYYQMDEHEIARAAARPDLSGRDLTAGRKSNATERPYRANSFRIDGDYQGRQLTDLQTEICRLDLDDANFGESLDYILGLAFSLRSQVAYTPRAQVPLTPPNPIGATTRLQPVDELQIGAVA